ncbi:MAG: nucleotide exchange factor GrpE [Candidatus Eremiobacteraeota bacterium]|nr:nucleotide exchange factor GrpE [Candidatus Eremiobacteraeota bacterium]MBC5802027.1 nucleotide exchange factor GrpE [Candidatus Eremiobacteraeota bacterium]MBC5822569.1 nucleotide exchange factor GrpE [Candidatus Eremiobacteraeota bacterium]
MDIDTQAAAEGTEDLGAPAAADGQSDLAAELTTAKALADERYADLQYARAEIDNVRKRAERSALERLAYTRRQLLERFLPVLDNLQRALAFDDSEGLRGGLQATLRGFEGVLASEQVTPLETVGKPFDPHVAEAIATRETSDYADDIVIEEAQRGYRMGDDLLRPAMVVVAKHVTPVDESTAPAPLE